MEESDGDRLAAHVRKVAASEGGVRCGVCARDVQGMASVCAECAAPYHADCWDYNGGCAVFGCKGAPRDPARVALEPKPPPPRRRIPLTAILAALALGIGSWYQTVRTATPVIPPSSGGFTIRLGGSPSPGAVDELAIEMRIVVLAERHADSPLLSASAPAPSAPIFSSALDPKGYPDGVRVVANPRIVCTEGRDTWVRVGRSLLFTGKADAPREPGALELRFRPRRVTDAGVDLDISDGAAESVTTVPWGTAFVAARKFEAQHQAPAFFQRWRIPGAANQEGHIMLIPRRTTPQ